MGKWKRSKTVGHCLKYNKIYFNSQVPFTTPTPTLIQTHPLLTQTYTPQHNTPIGIDFPIGSSRLIIGKVTYEGDQQIGKL